MNGRAGTATTQAFRVGGAPVLGPAWLLRPRIADALVASPPAKVVLFTAPAGYSKTTCLAEWAAADQRPFAWVSADHRHDDPAELIAAIVHALDRVGLVDATVLEALETPSPNVSGNVLPRLTASMRTQEPFVLVVDDVHAMTSGPPMKMLEALISDLPAGAQLALASRVEPDLSLGRLRARRELVEVGRSQLSLSPEEAAELLAEVGPRLNRAQADAIFERTEGWPVAQYLAGVALAEQDDVAAAVEAFAGDDRFVVDYLWDEFLREAGPEMEGFLTRSSVLEELSGPMCDEILERTGSGALLHEMARSNSLLIPLDRRDEAYRYHHLLSDLLRAELRRREPNLVAELNGRASLWYERTGELDRAIDHAIAAGDNRRAGELIWQGWPELHGRGRAATVTRWLDLIGEEEVARTNSLSLCAVHLNLLLGDGPGAEHWLRVGEGNIESAVDPERALADVSTARATVGAWGIGEMERDAARAGELLADDSPWQAPCFLFRGALAHLRGNDDDAAPLLEEAARRGAVASPVIQVIALSQLALIAAERDDSGDALRMISQASAQVARCGIDDYPSILIVSAASALVRGRAGQVEQARLDLAECERLLAKLADFLPWYEVQVRLVMARAYARLDDPARARALFDEAAVHLERIPDAGEMSGWVDRTSDAISSSAAVRTDLGHSLTKAELRTLQYLPSHLNFREIGERIHVSPNTVKTQAQAAYRKLGATSRAEAVEVAREAGLLSSDGLPGA